VSQDGLIDAITPDGFDHAYRPVYHEAENAVARAALDSGYTVIVDRTNRTKEHRRRWIQLAREALSPAVAVVMTTPEAVCRIRNHERGANRLSDRRMDGMFSALEPLQPEEGFDSIHVENCTGDAITLDRILRTGGSKQ
jgi:predicted kinase